MHAFTVQVGQVELTPPRGTGRDMEDREGHGGHGGQGGDMGGTWEGHGRGPDTKTPKNKAEVEN